MSVCLYGSVQISSSVKGSRHNIIFLTHVPLMTEAQAVPEMLFPSKSQDYVRCSKQSSLYIYVTQERLILSLYAEKCRTAGFCSCKPVFTVLPS